MHQPPHPTLRGYDAKPRRGQYSERKLWYRSPEFERDFVRLGQLQLEKDDNFRPKEQLVAIMKLFCLGGELNKDQEFKKVRPHPQHIFELRFGDARIFGWVMVKNEFVACHADVIQNTHNPDGPDLYKIYFNKVLAIRQETGLPCVESENLHEHFTNICT